MEEEAKVVAVKGKAAHLEIEKSGACDNCNACLRGNGGEMRIIAENSLGAREGDLVRIEINPKIVLKGSFFVYLMPIIGLILGALMAGKITDSEGIELLGGISGFILSSILIYYYLRRGESKEHFAARIIKIFNR